MYAFAQQRRTYFNVYSTNAHINHELKGYDQESYIYCNL